MTHYVVVQLAPKDEAVLQRYFERGGEAVRKHGGKPIAGGPDVAVLEDNGGGIAARVLLSFPSAEAAHDWIDDPELAEVHDLRRRGAQTTITLLPPM
jgi:uncharacterized protein (DUF1330 family)